MNKGKASHLVAGANAEQQALEQLQHAGLKLISKNFSCPCGEIDLIMQDRTEIVFIEVRYRKNKQFGGAEASITPSKQRKIRQTAAWFLNQQPHYQNYPCRFDIIALHQGETCGNWIKQAFE